MLGMDFIKANRAAVEHAIRDKGVTLDLAQLLELEEKARAYKAAVDTLRQERNKISAGFQKATSEEQALLRSRVRDLGAETANYEMQLETTEAEVKALLLKLPNIPYDGAPVGPDESFNVVMRQEGTPREFGFEPLDHVALIEKNDWADLSRITQVSGSRTYCLKGRLALLETKLMGWALERIAEAGFTPITVPAIAREQAFLNQGQFPGHIEETYALPNDDAFLAGTAEVALTSLHSGEIV